jgi:SAM-dependent methyltransferase
MTPLAASDSQSDSGLLRDEFEARYQIAVPLTRHIEARDFGWANILPSLTAAMPASGHFLDIGSGVGTIACLMASRGLRVTALDRAPAGVELGEAQARVLGVSNITFRQHDLDSDAALPVDSPVDVAFASEILEHVADDVAVLRRVRTCMTSAGLLVATSPSACAPIHRLRMRLSGADAMDEMRGHVRRYSSESLSAAAENAGFRECNVRPIAGLLRDCVFGSRVGLRAARAVKRPVTPVIQVVDRATMALYESQYALTARA